MHHRHATERFGLAVAPSLIVLLFGLWALPAPEARADEDAFVYEGVYPCRKCHSMTQRDYYDDAYELWEKSPHAHALESLENEKGLEVASDLGIADPKTDERCLRCHVTAYGVDESQLGKFWAQEEAVTCESCHGPGERYKKVQVHAEDYEGALKLGFRDIGSREAVEKTCVKCHNSDSPTYKPDPMDRWHEWQHPSREGRLGVEGPAKKDRGDWVPDTPKG